MTTCRCLQQLAKRYEPCPLEQSGQVTSTPMPMETQIVEVCPEHTHAGYWSDWDRSRALDAMNASLRWSRHDH